MSLATLRLFQCICGKTLAIGGSVPVRFPAGWTDGFVLYSDQRIDDVVLLCRSCGALTWPELATPIRVIEPPFATSTIDECNRFLASSAAIPLGLLDCHAALDSVPSVASELYLRRKIWHLRNHPLRDKSSQGHEPDAISNMQELLRLQTGTDGDGLERAELLRELGRWQEAKEALGHFRPRDAVESACAEAIARGIDALSALPLVVDSTRDQAEHVSDDEPVPWTWLDLLRAVAFAVGIVAAFTLLVLGGWLATRFLLPPGWFRLHLGPLRPYAPGIIALSVSVLLYGAALLGVQRFSLRKYHLPASALYLRHASWLRYLAMPVLYIPMQLGGTLILLVQARALGSGQDTTQRDIISMIAQAHWFNFVAVFLAVAVIAPVAEEIMFRGFLYRLLRKRLPAWAAVPISAALFAVLHAIPPLIPMLFFLGVVFALVVERTRSLYCSIILHALQNSVALSMILFATKLAPHR